MLIESGGPGQVALVRIVGAQARVECATGAGRVLVARSWSRAHAILAMLLVADSLMRSVAALWHFHSLLVLGKLLLRRDCQAGARSRAVLSLLQDLLLACVEIQREVSRAWSFKHILRGVRSGRRDDPGVLVDIRVAMLTAVVALIGKSRLNNVVKRLFLIKHRLLVGRYDVLCQSSQVLGWLCLAWRWHVVNFLRIERLLEIELAYD